LSATELTFKFGEALPSDKYMKDSFAFGLEFSYTLYKEDLDIVGGIDNVSDLGFDHGDLTTSTDSYKFTLRDYYLGARYNIFKKGNFIVSLGAGAGYYNFEVEVNSKGSYSHSDAFYDYYNIDSDTSSLASGMFAYAEIRAEYIGGRGFFTAVEARQDFLKEVNNRDLDATFLFLSLGFHY